MVTTLRSTEMSSTTYENNSANGGIALQVKPNVNEEVALNSPVDTEATERMKRNLSKLLNYDRFTEEQMQVEDKVSTELNFSDEDIRPTSTTMQFGDDNIEELREEMRKSEEEIQGYHLNSKGKVAVIIYSMVITVIFALIILNTGLLARLNAERQVAYADYNSAVAEYDQVMSNIESISSPEHVISVAENEYGMVRR